MTSPGTRQFYVKKKTLNCFKLVRLFQCLIATKQVNNKLKILAEDGKQIHLYLKLPDFEYS